ncbi:MAG TPA: phosphatidate cytidylyltransferase [Candidatus Cybelea sp.]|nr:phosphatidate cytidylyltransferase [Candidatus Cybelea sp.]
MDRPQAGALRLRIASALVLAPLALIFAWAGGWLLTVLVAAAALLMLGEWHSIMGGQAFDLPGVVRGVALFVALFVAGLGHATIAAIVILVLTTLVALAAAWNAGLPRWSAVGIAYIGLPCIALIWLRRNPEGGLGAVFWLFAVVWATDTAAYISGRLIGGPKLAPRFSPNKTWAGLIGGALAAALVGVFAARLMGDAPMLSMALASAGLAVVAQAGDLVESALKRRFGVKDASTLIPGHGGVLDRLDGMLFAAPVFVVLMMWTGGVQSWR